MYQFKPVSERVAKLRDEIRDRPMIGDAIKSRLKAEAQAKFKDFPPMVCGPSETLYMIQNMPIDIQ